MDSVKAELRKNYKAGRLAMSRDEVVSSSHAICRSLLEQTDMSNIRSLCVYQSIPRLNEIDTSLFVSKVWDHDSKLEIEFVGSLRNQPLPSGKFDLILVPTLAFDKNKYRLGWGAGWYDRFLATQPQALKIGLAYQAGLVEDGLPREPHDIQLNKIITEDMVY